MFPEKTVLFQLKMMDRKMSNPESTTFLPLRTHVLFHMFFSSLIQKTNRTIFLFETMFFSSLIEERIKKELRLEAEAMERKGVLVKKALLVEVRRVMRQGGGGDGEFRLSSEEYFVGFGRIFCYL